MNLHWGVFLEPTPFGDTTYLGWLWLGLQVTVLVSVCSGLIAFFVGSFFGILRTLPNPFLRTIGAVYVTYFRNIPLLIQLFIFVFVLPEIVPLSMKEWLFNLNPDIFNFMMGTICLGLFTGARVCDQVKAAIESISIGQKNAGTALGLNLRQIYLYVLLPNAYRRVLPPLTSEVLNMIKNSAVLSTIGLIDLSKQAGQLLDYTNRPYESFIAATIGYILINIVVLKLMHWVEKSVQLPGMIGGK